MNDKPTPQDAAFADALKDLAEHTTPEPEFANTLEAQLRARIVAEAAKGKPVNVRRLSFLRLPRAATAAAAVIVLTILTLTVPPLRTFAQDLLNLLFNRAPADTIVYETPTVFDIAPTATSRIVDAPSTSIPSIEAQSGFDVHVPMYLPDGYQLFDASYDTEARQTSLIYTRNEIALTIVQVRVADAYPLNVGASAQIVSVQIGANTGQYVEGIWRVNPDVNGTTATVDETSWDSSFPFQQLRWQDGDFVFWMMSAAGQHSDLSLEEWVHIAESLR